MMYQIFFTALLIILLACDHNNKNVPVVKIISPDKGDTLVLDTTLLVKTRVYDADENIKNVTFFLDDELVSIDHEWPFEISISSLSAGRHTIRTVVTDHDELHSDDIIQISVVSISE